MGGAPAAEYGYDANGNRTSGPGAEAATYDAQDRLLTYGDTTYTYSANGDLATKTTAAGTTTYSYDELGNLVAAVLPGGTEIEYVIDGLGRRVGRMVDGTLERGWLYDGDLAIVAELDGTGAVVSRFVYATGDNVPDYLEQGGEAYRLVTDHLGSLRLVVRASDGHVVQRMNHDEFGRVTEDHVEAGFDRVPFGYAGGLYDPDTGLVRFGARDYDAETGRWTAKDPIGFGGGDGNLYGYVAGDPINMADPDGLIPTWEAYVRSQKAKLAAYASRLRGSREVSSMLSSAIAKAHNLPYLEYSKKVSKLSNSLAISQTKLNANLYRSTLCPTSFKPKPVLLRPGRWLAPTAKLFRRVAPPLLAVGFVLDAKTNGLGHAAVGLTPAGIGRDIYEVIESGSDPMRKYTIDTEPPNRW